jgi:ATP-dependent DNA helicase RecQ
MAARTTGVIEEFRTAAPIADTKSNIDKSGFRAGEVRMNAAWEWNDINEQKAKKRFGIKHYRAGQRKLIQAVLEGRDTLGILPTGGGKSLCYQLPALFLPRAVLVVSPLISLMQDQQEKLSERSIPAAGLDSTLNSSEEEETINTIQKRQAELIYVTPERLENPEYLKILKRGGVSLVVVDEAHCVSQWGHDFRPAYLSLRNAIRDLGRPPVLTLTATATDEVAADILKQLDLPEAEVISIGIERKNLAFEVVRTVNEDVKRDRLRQLLQEQSGDAGIIYVPTVKQVDTLCQWLIDEGFRAGQYHGRMKMPMRETNQQAFMANEVDVMVATKAFGLGIDKQDIRFVIHYAVPDSIETYVQETGRAGRDGKPARAILFYRLEDRRVQSYFLGGKYPRRDESLALYRTLDQMPTREDLGDRSAEQWLAEVTNLTQKRVTVILALLESTGVIQRKPHVSKIRDFNTDEEFVAFLEEYEQRHNGDRQRLDAMMLFGQITTCRMRYLLDYFDEEVDSECGRCDNCRAAQEAAENTAETGCALSDGALKPSAGSSGIGASLAVNS